ncbi:MAG: cupin domain-containing protein [Opitutus sp.]
MALLPLQPFGFAQGTAPTDQPKKLGSSAFIPDQLVLQKTPVGERRDVARNPTATFEEFESHISTLNPGQPSHPPHRHPQEELIILMEGTLSVHINGTEQRVGPGSLFFFASYDAHAVRNVGTVPATYYVFNFATAATKTIPATPATEVAAPGKLVSTVFDWTKLPVKPTAKGERRDVVDSPTTTLTNFESHVTTLRAGEEAHPSHRHPDEELILVKEGTVQATVNGVVHRGGPGTIFFYGSNDDHGMRNVGTTNATYFVIRIVTAATPKP